MSKLSVQEKSAQEKRLDEAQDIVASVLRQVRYRITSYNLKDVRALEEAYSALSRVTLLTDEEAELV